MYIHKRVVNVQALANFLADHPIPNDWELTNELPDIDVMSIEILPPWKCTLMGLHIMVELASAWCLSLHKKKFFDSPLL